MRKTRRPKTGRVTRTRASGQWTEASFFQFIRSGLRRMSMRWGPIVSDALSAVRRPYAGSNKRQKWEYQCAECAKWFDRKKVQVDHINECGSLKCFDDLPGFVERLFCEVDELQVLCLKCHDRKHE